MRTLSDVNGKPIYAPKKGKSGSFERLGKAHLAVFSPDGKKVVGFLVKRPDIVGMVKRPDVFVALDALAPVDGGYRVTLGDESYDKRARERLGLDWDLCVMWAGMDAKTTKGTILGYVGDASFDETTGQVSAFFIGDGGVAESLVGSVQVPVDMLVGYKKGFMLLKPEAASQELTGGLAGKAGEAAAKAKAGGAKVADKGSKAIGKQIGRTKGMFGAFMDEYKKASQ